MTQAKEQIFPEMLRSSKKASEIARELKLGQVLDEEETKRIAAEILKRNPGPLKQYREGKTRVFGFFVGEVMRETKGAADGQLVQKILKDLLGGNRARP